MTQEQIDICKDLYINQKKSLWDIQDITGIKYNILRKELKRHFDFRKTGEILRKFTDEIASQIAIDYQNKKSVRQLAKDYVCDRAVIYRILKEKNVKQRTALESCAKKILDENKIKELYLSGVSIYRISKDFSVTCSTIRKRLEKMNLCQVANGKKWDRNRKKINEIQEKEIIDLYLNHNISCGELGRRYKTNHCLISNLLKTNNIEIRKRELQTQNYKINQNYFENIDSPSKAFLLGLLYTDGCVIQKYSKYRLCLELQSQDKHLIDFLAKELQTDKPLKYHSKRDTYSIEITNKKIVLDLIKNGCVPNKTHILKYPQWLDKNLFPHFFHGCIMGDGSVMATCESGNFAVTLTGTKDLCENIRILIDKYLNQRGTLREHSESKGIYYLAYSGSHQSLKVCNFIFKDAPTLMVRKFNKYLKIIDYKINVQDKTEIEKQEMYKAVEIANNLKEKHKDLILEAGMN